MCKVSIIMGIYNCEDTLGEAINSLIDQTLSDWELVLCDDGSSDRTYQIAEQYRQNYPQKIILLRNSQNCGLNYTLNKCLKAASGEYIARMDGDDISLPTRLEKEAAFLDEHPEYAIVSTPMIFFDEQGDWGRSYSIKEPTKKDFIKHSPVFCHAPCMIRREAYFSVDGYTVDKHMLRFEDVNLWYKLYAKNYIGYNLEEPLYKMRDDFNAIKRRNQKSRMNGVYVTYVGFKLFEFPWYIYIYVIVDFFMHLIKGLMPTRLYTLFHKKEDRQW